MHFNSTGSGTLGGTTSRISSATTAGSAATISKGSTTANGTLTTAVGFSTPGPSIATPDFTGAGGSFGGNETMKETATSRVTPVGCLVAALLLVLPGPAAARGFRTGVHPAPHHGFGIHHHSGFFMEHDLNSRRNLALRQRFGDAIHQVHPHAFLSGHTFLGRPGLGHDHSFHHPHFWGD